MRLDPNNEVDKIEKKLPRSFIDAFTESERLLDSEYEEQQRLRRMDEIEKQANDARIARCEAKMVEVGKDEFMNLIHGWGGKSGKELWSDSEGMIEIEKEYWRLFKEQFHCDWLRDHGKPYRMEDDPNAQF